MSPEQPADFHEVQPFSRLEFGVKSAFYAVICWLMLAGLVRDWLGAVENPRIVGALLFLIGVALLLLVIYLILISGPLLTTLRDGVLDMRYGAESPLRRTIRVSQIVRAELMTIEYQDNDDTEWKAASIVFESYMISPKHNTGVKLTLSHRRTHFISSARSGELLACLQSKLDQS